MSDVENSQPGSSAPGSDEPQRVEPNAQILAEANEMQAAKDENGRRFYEHDPAYREKVEAFRRTAFEAPAPQLNQSPEPTAPAEPVGTPEERAAEEIQQRFESGEVIAPNEVDPAQWSELTAGYHIHDILPPGFGLDGDAAALLADAKAAGISERQVRYVVQAMIEANK